MDYSERTLRIRVARHLLDRCLGLNLLKTNRNNQALLLVPCRSIHTFTMSQDIDVAFLDSSGRVIKSLRNLRPGRLASCRRARATLERFSRPAETWLEVGESLEVVGLEFGGRPDLRPEGSC